MHGDYLTFESIHAAVGMKHEPFEMCEIRPGIWRRYPDLPPEKSRSDISRDGVMGVLFWCAVNGNKEIPRRMVKAGIKNGFKMGERGNWDYVSMLPIVPLILMVAYGKWIPTPPTLAVGKLKTGFRAHLVALTILIERAMGKRRLSHRLGSKQLLDANPQSAYFKALHAKTCGNVHKPPLDTVTYDWGGCSEDLYRQLVRFTCDKG